MSAFSYSALDAQGKQCKGVLEADSARHARQLLREQGSVALTVDQVTSQIPSSDPSTSTTGKRAGSQEIALFTRQLATLLRSGMPLEECLQAIGEQAESSRLRTLVMSLRSRVREGYPLAAAMRSAGKQFPDMYCAMVEAGEHSGRLDVVLERLAEHSEVQTATRQKMLLALIYPIMLLAVSLLTVIGLVTFVVPEVVNVFAEQGQQLPVLTQGLLAVSGFMLNYGIWLVGAIVLLVWLALALLRQTKSRLAWHKMLAHWLPTRRLSRASNSSQFSAAMSILLRSGVPVVEALEIARNVVPNEWLQQRLEDSCRQVSEGGSLSAALRECEFFPPMMLHITASGEASGSLAEMLQRAADNEQQALDNLIAAGLKLIEPIVLLIMGGLVFLIVLAVLQPIFAMNQLI